MRKFSLLLSVLVLTAMILAACGGEETSTNIPSTNVPPVTTEVTPTSAAGSATPAESSTPAAVPTETTTTGTTETPGIPVTGATNADRLSNELKFKVLDQSGKQVGKVADMVLDLSKAKLLYVVVGAEKQIPVPWSLLKVGADPASSNANGQQNAFILQTDTETFKKAPALDLKKVPGLGEAPDSWDISFRKYWAEGGATSGTNVTNTPSPAGTAATDLTATATSTGNSAGTGTGNATSTPAASASTTQGAGTGQGATTIQGVQLASKVLGAKVTVGVEALVPGTSTPGAGGAGTSTTATASPAASGATATASTGTSLATSTPSSAGTSVATATSSSSTSQTASTPSTGVTAKNLSVTIDDMIVGIDSGDILNIVVKTNFDDGEHLIPVPLKLLQLNISGPASDTSDTSNNKAFVLNTDAATLQNAPFFQKDQFPDLTTPGWNSEFDSFWQNNGSGQGTGAQATATP